MDLPGYFFPFHLDDIVRGIQSRRLPPPLQGFGGNEDRLDGNNTSNTESPL